MSWPRYSRSNLGADKIVQRNLESVVPLSGHPPIGSNGPGRRGTLRNTPNP